MKRFLVCMMGDGDKYINSYVVAEISKGGEPDVLKMINGISNHGVNIPWEGSTLRYVYKIIYGENRKEVLDEADMIQLYKANIQKYSES